MLSYNAQPPLPFLQAEKAPLPHEAQPAYSLFLQWSMEMLFTDFMSDRAYGLQRSLPDEFEAAHSWVVGMVGAAGDLVSSE